VRARPILPPIALLLLALLLRLPGLDRWPPALNQDEASNGVDAWSLLTTGSDRAGRVWPVFLEGFGAGDNRTSLYAILAIPGTALLGPGTTSTRLPAALLGGWTVLATFLFVRRVRGTRAATIAAVLLAISPWHIYLSRFGHEASITPAFLVTALWLLAAGRWWIAGAILGAGLYTYPSFRLFMPALLAVCAFAGFRPERDRKARYLFVGLAAAALPLVVASISHLDRLLARARYTSVLGNVEPVGAALALLVTQYARHFGPRFLFLHGDRNPMLTPAGFGELAWPLILALPCGIWIAARRRDHWDRLLLAWLLLYPIASASSLGDRPEYVPHALRAAVGLPVFEILGGVGIVGVLEKIRRSRWRLGAGTALAIAGGVNLALFGIAFTGDFARRVEPLYHSAHVRAIRYAASHRAAGDQVLINASDNPQAYVHAILFGLQTPREYRTAEKTITQTETFHLVGRAGPLFYIRSAEDASSVRADLRGRVIAIVRPGEMQAGRRLESFPYADGSPGFEVREVDLAPAPPQRR
jgi:4-amino-4-deoxy-L-arabinose transferase-like glycosyltransferase